MPWGTSFAQRPLLFHNVGGKQFELVPAVEGTGLGQTYEGRGLAVGDLFNDGKLDVVINVMDGAPALLRNVSPDKHHWIELKLVGGREEPAGCCWRNRLPDREQDAPARRCDLRRQLCLNERSAAALWTWRCHGDRRD